ncbi:MAG: FecR domain-containing protein [Chitinophagaceae bacterium]
MEKPEQFNYLYSRYVANQATPEELTSLFGLIADEQNNEQLKQLLGETLDQLQVGPGSFNITPVTIPDIPAVPVRQISPWKKIAVAASITLILGLGTYVAFFNKARHSGPEPEAIAQTDVPAPATNRAMVTLADGSIVYLDSAGNGQLAIQQNVKLTKTADGKIIYESPPLSTRGEGSGVTFNTLSNPRGSKVIDMTLSDGSHVWLNAGSSITYPVAFITNERKVAITGEAYFEITHDASKPFRVSMAPSPSGRAGGEVEVLGTHFNVNAYDDENEIKVTLLEGSVKVIPFSTRGEGQGLRLTPGQQAVIARNEAISTNNSPDLEQVMAWKNGLFSYKGVDINTIMRQVEKWYDVEIVFEKDIKERFYAEVPRNTNISTLLKMLETTKAVHFEIDGKKVKVKH